MCQGDVLTFSWSQEVSPPACPRRRRWEGNQPQGLPHPPLRALLWGRADREGPECVMRSGGRESPHTVPALRQGSGGGRGQQQPGGKKAGVPLRSNYCSWGPRVKPLKGRPLLPFGGCHCVGGRPGSQGLSSTGDALWGKVIPSPRLRPILAMLGMGNTHPFCPAEIKEATEDLRRMCHVRAQPAPAFLCMVSCTWAWKSRGLLLLPPPQTSRRSP